MLWYTQGGSIIIHLIVLWLPRYCRHAFSNDMHSTNTVVTYVLRDDVPEFTSNRGINRDSSREAGASNGCLPCSSLLP